MDDDQRIWLYFGFAPHFPMRGQPIPDSMGAYCVELEQDMMTCKGEPVNIMPDFAHAAGTEYEAHPFFEAASIRKINGKYYFVYCSRAMHELCYAVSHRPDGDYHFGGVMVSSSDVGYQGRATANARNQIANIHGGMFEANGQWYIGYHRHTNGTQFCRQGCMEPISINADGSINQVECTSFGLSGGCIDAKGTIPGWCACNMYKGQGGLFIKFGPVRQVDAPYVVLEEVENQLQSYVSNITDDCLVGYRYLRFDGSEKKLNLNLKGKGQGKFQIFLTDADDEAHAELRIDADSEIWQEVSVNIQPASGKYPLRLRYTGEGMLELGNLTIE